MKNSFLILVIIACFKLTVYSQKKPLRFDGGLNGGVVVSQMSGDALAGWDKPGITAGGWVHINYNNPWGTFLGMAYVPKGSRKNADPDNGDFDTFILQLDYIDVPILATYKTERFRFNAGPSFGILLRQNIKFNGTDFDVAPSFRRIDASIAGGVTWFASRNIHLEVRGSTSFIPVRPAPSIANPASFYERGNYNHVLQFCVHYSF